MKRFLFFAYREWAINIFNRISNDEDEFLLITNKNSCTKNLITTINPDIIFFYGWSWIVPNSIIDNYTCLCIHPSPLPKYRGGSPLHNQIIAGEKNSAMTIFKMDYTLDTGPIYYQESFSLDGYLDTILSNMELIGYKGTLKFIFDYKNNSVVFKEQDHKRATIYKRRTPKESEIIPNDFYIFDAKYFFNKVRMLQSPYPECYIHCKTGKLILKEVAYE